MHSVNNFIFHSRSIAYWWLSLIVLSVSVGFSAYSVAILLWSIGALGIGALGIGVLGHWCVGTLCLWGIGALAVFYNFSFIIQIHYFNNFIDR